MWAIGIMAYFLLSGNPPFDNGRSCDEVLLRTAQFVFMPSEIWRPISSEAKSFISQCLQCEPASRPAAMKAVLLPWMRLANKAIKEFELHCNGQASTEENPSKLSLFNPPLSSAEIVLNSLRKRHKFQFAMEVAMSAAVNRLDPVDLSDLTRSFENDDKNRDYSTTMDIFAQKLSDFNVDVSELASLVSVYKGAVNEFLIDYHDFLEEIEMLQNRKDKHEKWTLLRSFDEDVGGMAPKRQIATVESQGQFEKVFNDNFATFKLENVCKYLVCGS